jgi:MFS family permease
MTPRLAAATGSLGLAAGGVAAALLAVAMTGRAAAAGLPLGALAAGQAGASLLVGRLTGRSGRGAGLVLGYALGVAGATTVLVAPWAAGSRPCGSRPGRRRRWTRRRP